MSIKNKTSIDILKKLQKRLIINDVSAQTFYTKFNPDRSTKVADLVELGQLCGIDIFKDLFKNKTITLSPTRKKCGTDE
jgi:hypothetical protein